MKTTIGLLICVGLATAFGASVSAASQARKKEVISAEVAPSVELSKFISKHLDKILGPLEPKVKLPRREVSQLRASFHDRLKKGPDAQQPQMKAAIDVCDALLQAMDERDKAKLYPTNSNWPQRSAQLRLKIEELAARERATEKPTVASPNPGRG